VEVTLYKTCGTTERTSSSTAAQQNKIGILKTKRGGNFITGRLCLAFIQKVKK
jgi:hypothetical protein